MYLFQAVARFDHHKLANHKVYHSFAKYTWKIWMENGKSAMRIFKWVLKLLCTHCTAENCIHRLFLFFNLFQTRWNEIFVKNMMVPFLFSFPAGHDHYILHIQNLLELWSVLPTLGSTYQKENSYFEYLYCVQVIYQQCH